MLLIDFNIILRVEDERKLSKKGKKHNAREGKIFRELQRSKDPIVIYFQSRFRD
ncbi:predicted protein [Sclerotinia sclerotiorum 1980 UF-70]|uniref:Uncharacterized protein n=1 Tax=Sclerotinia sclerotiorum (strain ATCC 18683 / 1980 / Ss-1) TaxID=665079 RepID=A7EQT2_SCLS1|nr:predicted protein [Sclerotinia sclerotiorum 1980 UF-70]EDN91824.1 predicted protein [Sclerotinia sclerotiorum 1980 UF-70]